jgi:hypothetical protein
MKSIFVVKQFDNSLKAMHDSDLDVLRKIKAGAMIEIKLTQKRNVKHHRKAFSLFNLVLDNQDHYNNIDHLRSDLTKAAGYYTERKAFNGSIVVEAKSISFSSMNQSEFDKYYEALLDAIQKYFHFDKESVRDEIEKNF